MKPPANQPATVAASFDGRLTKYGSMRPARAPASQPRTMAARSRTRPTASRTASDPRRARIALLDFIAEVLPDLLVEPRELLAEANLDHVARPRQRDRIAGLDPTRRRHSVARARVSAAGRRRIVSGSATFCSAVFHGSSASRWKR